jgi:hypothetical protein
VLLLNCSTVGEIVRQLGNSYRRALILANDAAWQFKDPHDLHGQMRSSDNDRQTDDRTTVTATASGALSPASLNHSVHVHQPHHMIELNLNMYLCTLYTSHSVEDVQPCQLSLMTQRMALMLWLNLVI